MLSYITDQFKTLFSGRHEQKSVRKRSSKMVRLGCDSTEPVIKRFCQRKPLTPSNSVAQEKKPNSLAGSLIGTNRVQDWFIKIGQMAANPVVAFSISHTKMVPDHLDSEDEYDYCDFPVQKQKEQTTEPDSQPTTHTLTREPLHSDRRWKAISNGDPEKSWNGHWEETVSVSKEIVTSPGFTFLEARSVRPKKKASRLNPANGQEIQNEYPSQQATSSLKKFNHTTHITKSSTPLESIRLDEKEQYSMLIEQQQFKSAFQLRSSADFSRRGFTNSTPSVGRDLHKNDHLNKEKLTASSKKELLRRLHSAPGKKTTDTLPCASQKENFLKPSNYGFTSKGFPPRTEVSTSMHALNIGNASPFPRRYFGNTEPDQTCSIGSGLNLEERLSKCSSYQDLQKTLAEKREMKSAFALSKDKTLHKRNSFPSLNSFPSFEKEIFSPGWLTDLQLSVDDSYKARAEKKKLLERLTQNYQDKREAKVFAANRKSLIKLTKSLNLKATDSSEEEEALPEITAEMQLVIDDALRPTPPDEVLCEGFRLSIARRDMETLSGLNWLNDEIINFYMNLLMERGKNDNFPSVYAFNTFFYPKLISGGHNALRRWTRQVDIFSHHFVLIPIHLGMHWCLAVIDFHQKKIQYYDSMGGQNNECINTLRTYLQDESRDKKKVEFATSDWKLENVKNIPQQMNGSDCGMFTLKYAEYITRNAKITFSQRHMAYFRRRMIYEIVKKQLL